MIQHDAEDIQHHEEATGILMSRSNIMDKEKELIIMRR